MRGVVLGPEPEGHGDIEDGSGVLVGMVPVPGRGWSTGSAEVADSCRRHWRPDRALGQNAVGVPAALRWQTVAGGIGSRKGKGPTKWEGPPAAVCHLSAPKQSQQTSCNQQHNKAAQQSSRNKAATSICNKAAATKQPQQKHKRLTQTGQPLFHLRKPESPISQP